MHYRKTVGFSDAWSRVSTDVTASGAVIDRVALSALGGGELVLFYSKSDAGIYYRLWSGSAWSGEATLQAASATPLQGAFTVAELADGCTVGLAWTEKAASPFDVRFQAVSVPCGGMRVKSGTYTGTGLARSITGVGFQPDVVIIDGVNGGAANAVIRTSTMANPDSKELDQPTALAAGQITSLNADGFSLGTDTDVNENTRTYYWVAFKAAPGALRSTPTPRGRGPGRHGHRFQPDYVIVMSPNAAQTMQRSALMPPGFCLNFAGPPTPTRSSTRCPTASASARTRASPAPRTFHYVAWNASPGAISVGRYAGNKADGRSITGAGFQPEYVIVDRSHEVGSATGDATGNAPVHKTAASGVNTDSRRCSTATSPRQTTSRRSRPTASRWGRTAVSTATGLQRARAGRLLLDGVRPAHPQDQLPLDRGRRELRRPGRRQHRRHARLDERDQVGGPGWKTQNRGRGDVLTVGANSYVITWVNSDNQLTLASPAVANYSAAAYTIARQFRGAGTSYPALVDWEDCVDGGPCPAVCASRERRASWPTTGARSGSPTTTRARPSRSPAPFPSRARRRTPRTTSA